MTKKLMTKIEKLEAEFNGPTEGSYLITFPLGPNTTLKLWLKAGADNENNTFKDAFLFGKDHLILDEVIFDEDLGEFIVDHGLRPFPADADKVETFMNNVAKILGKE